MGDSEGWESYVPFNLDLVDRGGQVSKEGLRQFLFHLALHLLARGEGAEEPSILAAEVGENVAVDDKVDLAWQLREEWGLDLHSRSHGWVDRFWERDESWSGEVVVRRSSSGGISSGTER